MSRLIDGHVFHMACCLEKNLSTIPYHPLHCLFSQASINFIHLDMAIIISRQTRACRRRFLGNGNRHTAARSSQRFSHRVLGIGYNHPVNPNIDCESSNTYCCKSLIAHGYTIRDAFQLTDIKIQSQLQLRTAGYLL